MAVKVESRGNLERRTTDIRKSNLTIRTSKSIKENVFEDSKPK